nr:AbiH family protein [uncultured Anaerotignum sp.]
MKSLVIIGNGFDLGHHLHTTFKDFIQSNIKFEEKYKIFKGTNWNDVESNYKELLTEIMMKREFQDIGDLVSSLINAYGFDKYGMIDYVPGSSDSYASEIGRIKEYVDLLTEFECDFTAYLKHICGKDELNKIAPRKRVANILNSASVIINFNYTNLVEEVYQIKTVKHIHGTIDEKNIAIGTNALDELKESMIDASYPTEYPCRDKHDLAEKMMYYVEDENGLSYEDEQMKSFFYEIKESVLKKEEELFTLLDKKSKDALSSRNGIKKFLEQEIFDEVVVLGHAIGDADMSVFGKINKSAKIKCYFYENRKGEESQNKMRYNLKSLKMDFEMIPNENLYEIG